MIRYLLVGLVVLLLTYCFVEYIAPQARKDKWKKDLERILKNADPIPNIKKSGDPHFDFLLSVNRKQYALKVVRIIENAEITVNNATTWEMHYGGGEYFGRPYKKCRFLPEVKTFLSWETDMTKVAIFTPEAKRILKWVNECEMIFVTPNAKINGVYMLNMSQLAEFMRLN